MLELLETVEHYGNWGGIKARRTRYTLEKYQFKFKDYASVEHIHILLKDLERAIELGYVELRGIGDAEGWLACSLAPTAQFILDLYMQIQHLENRVDELERHRPIEGV